MKQKLFALFAAAALLLGMSACTKEDNPVTPPEGEVTVPAHEIDPNEFQPIDVSVALLGSLSNYGEVAAYWFKDVQGQVTDKTMVVITDEITAANKADIIKVLDRYGMMLLVDPKEDNVRQYAEEMGIDPNADYSKLELIGLTGLGDQYLSYNNDDESASGDPIAPTSFASDAIWDVAPGEYLRLKAFAQWVDQVDKKYTEYQKQLEELEEDEKDAWADDEPAQTRGTSVKALTRSTGGDVKTGLSLNSVPAVDKSINVTYDEKFTSFHNSGRDDDTETCYFSATCNYHFIPLYQFPQGQDPGGDYYIIETSMNWDCSKTDMGYYKYSHGALATARDSYRFFPLQCTLYSTPIPKKSGYEIVVPVDGEIYPENVPHETTVNKSRNFELSGNISAGGGFKKGADGTEGEGNLSADIGFGANYSKTQDYTVAEINVDKYTDGSSVGHIFSVPTEYHPKKESGHTPTIYVEKGTNFSKTLSVNESWIWKVNGTKLDTDDVPFDIELTVKPKVCWYSYFFAVESLDRKDYEVEMKGITTVPAPVRTNHAFLTINNNRVTDTASKEVVYKKKSTDKAPGESVRLALPANREYDIELKMGTEWNNKETYILEGWEVEGYADAESTSTSVFSKKKK